MSIEDPDGQTIGTWAKQLWTTPTTASPDGQPIGSGLVSSGQLWLPKVLIRGALSTSPSLKACVNKSRQSTHTIRMPEPGRLSLLAYLCKAIGSWARHLSL